MPVGSCAPAFFFVAVPFIVQRLIEGTAHVEPFMEQGEDLGVLVLRLAGIGERVAIGVHCIAPRSCWFRLPLAAARHSANRSSM